MSRTFSAAFAHCLHHSDTTVFSLAALLCSTLIFNGSSAINEESIQNLGFIANLTQHIRVRSAHGGSGGGKDEDTLEDFNRFFPSFLWVLRDFGLALVDDEGSVVSADDYMEDALEEQPGFDKETLARNRIRKCVKNYFRERHCFTLVRPVEDESALQELDLQVSARAREGGASGWVGDREIPACALSAAHIVPAHRVSRVHDCPARLCPSQCACKRAGRPLC